MDRSKWEYKKLGDISVFLTGCRPKGGVAQIKEGVHSLGGEHIGKDGYVDLSSPKYVPESFFINNKGHIKDNDILLCKDGALSGKVAIVRGELNDTKAMVNEHVFIIRSDSLLHKYLFYYLFSPTGQYQLKLRISGAAQGGINGANLSTIIVPYPKDVSLQQRIVAELDCLNEMIAVKQEQLKEFDKLAQSIFYDMFGDPVSNEKGWEMILYKDFAEIIGGYAFKSDMFVDSGVPVLKIGNINSGELKLEGICYYPYSSSLERYEVHSGDLVISLTGTTGKDDYGNICVIPKNSGTYYLNQRNAILKPNETCNRLYLQFVFKQSKIKEELTKNCRGVRQANILNKDIMNLSIPLPPLTLQQQFAEKISAIEAQKELVKQSIAETQALLDYTMDKYFG